MIVKGLEDRIQTVIVEQEVDGSIQQIPIDKVVGQNIYKIEVDEICMFREMINPRTNKPFKSKCLLRTVDGWIVVKHTMKQLQDFKKNLHQKIEIKGFRK